MRILIDCTGINIRKRVLTGIPRVVQNYLCFGYEFGQSAGIQVLPVAFHHGHLALLPASESFPHPQGYQERRGGLRQIALRGAFGVALGVGYALLALPWLGFQAVKAAQTSPLRAAAVQRACDSFGQYLLEPSDYLNTLLHRPDYITPTADDVLFSPAYWHDQPPEHFQALRQKLGHMAVLIHDVIPASHPQYYKSPWREMFRDNAAKALTGFDSVFAISHYTANMLRQLFPDEARQAQLAVCHNGLEPLPLPATPPDCARHFDPALPPLLMVGTIEPKKGHVQVLRALEALWDSGQIDRKLVIIGRKGWMYDDIVTALTHSRHRNRVIWLTNADDDALAYAYHHAHALIHASSVEGFGLPMIEAAAAGTPVLARKTDIAVEVLGAFGRYFDGDDAASLRAALLALEDPTEHAACRAAVASFSWPEWRDVAWAFFTALVDRVRNKTPLPTEIVAKPAP